MAASPSFSPDRVLVGNDAGWALSFHRETGHPVLSDSLLLIGRDQYDAEIEAALPNGELLGGAYRVVVEGLIAEHYDKIAALRGAGVMRLYLYWRDTNASLGGYLANVLGLTDLAGPTVLGSEAQLSGALVAELAIVRISRRAGARRYETEILACERVAQRLAAQLDGPFSKKGYRAAATAIGRAAGVYLIPYLDEERNPAAAAALDQETAAYAGGRSWGDCLRDMAAKLGQATGQSQRGYLLARDGVLHWGIRPIPLEGGEPKTLDLSSGLIETRVTDSVARDPRNPGDGPRRQFTLTLKGRGDLKPGDVVAFVLPEGNQQEAAIPAVVGAALLAAGGLVASFGPDPAPTLAYVESVRHRLGRTSGFSTLLTAVEMRDAQDGWDAPPAGASRPGPDAAASSAGSAEHAEQAARHIQRIARAAAAGSHLAEVAEVREAHSRGAASPGAPSQTLRVWQGLDDPDGLGNAVRRLPIRRAEPAPADGVAYASPFAWGRCGLVLPRYPGTRVLLNYRNGDGGDPVEVGALWESGNGPDSQPGDWWLSLPAGVDPDQRAAVPDSAGAPAAYAGKVTNDLTDADGGRVIEVAGLTIRVGQETLRSAGARPDRPAHDGTLTIGHSNGRTAIVLGDGRIELKADDDTSIVVEQGTITLKTHGVSAKLDAGAGTLDVS